MDLLNLSNLKAVDMKEFDDDYRFLVESTAPPPSHCPKCGTIPNLYKHGKKERVFGLSCGKRVKKNPPP